LFKENDFANIGEYACGLAKSSGVIEAEAYLSRNDEIHIEVRDGLVETMKLAQEQGLGLRVMLAGRAGFAFTTELTREAIQEIVKQAIANARATVEDPYRKLPPPSPAYPELDLFDSTIIDSSITEKIKLAQTLEEAAKACDSRVKIIESSSYQDGQATVFLVNTLGQKNIYRSSYCGLSISLVAEEGTDQQTGFAMDYRLRLKGLNPLQLGQEAAARATRMLGAKPVTTRQVPVILEPYVAVGFFNLLGSALTAEAVQKGRSFFRGKEGQKVASEKINLIDDGLLPDGLATAPFDGEGVPASRTVLIQGGVLKGFLYNVYTAAKDNVASTGNGIRSSFRSTPEVGTSNFFCEPGDTLVKTMIGELKEGFYVTEVIGMHTANPISGDFSMGATGILIENGELTRPVRGVAIAGNIQELLQQVDSVGNDLKFFGGHGSPSIRVAQMSVGGH